METNASNLLAQQHQFTLQSYQDRQKTISRLSESTRLLAAKIRYRPVYRLPAIIATVGWSAISAYVLGPTYVVKSTAVKGCHQSAHGHALYYYRS